MTSGLDIWSKRVEYPIIDRWYNKGHDHYHYDQGEGMDMYGVSKSRGCGGTGVWDGSTLYVGRNYRSWKIITNGPVRAVFELTYDAWDANGVKVSEVKRFTVDAGQNLDQMDSTFTVEGGKDIVVAIGLNKNPADKGQEPVITVTKDAEKGVLGQWIVQKTNAELGTAVIIPKDTFQGFAEDNLNLLALAKASSGKPLRYYVGAGWTRAGHYPTKEAWDAYVNAYAQRIASPIKIQTSKSK